MLFVVCCLCCLLIYLLVWCLSCFLLGDVYCRLFVIGLCLLVGGCWSLFVIGGCGLSLLVVCCVLFSGWLVRVVSCHCWLCVVCCWLLFLVVYCLSCVHVVLSVCGVRCCCLFVVACSLLFGCVRALLLFAVV